MNRAIKFVLPFLIVCAAVWIYDRTTVAGLNQNHQVPVAKVCQAVDGIDFALGVDSRGPILAVTPGSQPQTRTLQLQHVSQLETSTLALCEGFAPGATRCGEINAFTWGYDWLPLKNPPTPDSYCFDSLYAPAAGQPGWAILYFVRDNKIFGLAWGEKLEQRWPAASNGNLVRIQNSSYPPISAQAPLHTAASLDLADKTILGLDFNAWVNPIGAGGAGGTQKCFPLPSNTQQYPARLYYASPYNGEDYSGLFIWYTEPVQDSQENWAWSAPALLSSSPISDFPRNVEVDSLAFDRREIVEGAGSGHRHLMISVVSEGEPWPPVTPGQFDQGPGSYYIVPVDGDDGVASFGKPKPLYIELDSGPSGDPGDQVLLQAILGPRSRGTCPTDPTFYKEGDRVMEASSPKGGR